MKTRKRNNNPAYALGILFSFVCHLFFAVVCILVLESRAAQAVRTAEVFTVTLEGGEKLGGVTQIPDKLPEKQEKAPPAVHSQPEVVDPPEPVAEVPEEPSVEEVSVTEQVSEPETTPDADVESPSVIAEREEAKAKAEAEAKKVEELKKAEEKKKADEKKKAEEAKRKADEAKRKIEEAKKRELQKKAQEAKARADRKKAFEQRLNQVRQGLSEKKYEGESYDAGGDGFGAARLGGQGMGGGTLASIEKVAYMSALEDHIKRGWRWIMGNQKLTAVVRFRILQDGTLQNITLAQSSGNGNFDDSVMRAVQKSSPVPPPPSKFYRDFSDVRLIFDSKE